MNRTLNKNTRMHYIGELGSDGAVSAWQFLQNCTLVGQRGAVKLGLVFTTLVSILS